MTLLDMKYCAVVFEDSPNISISMMLILPPYLGIFHFPRARPYSPLEATNLGRRQRERQYPESGSRKYIRI